MRKKKEKELPDDFELMLPKERYKNAAILIVQIKAATSTGDNVSSNFLKVPMQGTKIHGTVLNPKWFNTKKYYKKRTLIRKFKSIKKIDSKKNKYKFIFIHELVSEKKMKEGSK